MKTTDYHLNDRLAYFRELIAFAQNSNKGDRIAVMSMAFDPAEPIIGELMQALTAAAGRGAQVTLSVDAINFVVREHPFKLGPLWFGTLLSPHSPEPFGSSFAALEALREAGGTYGITNPPGRKFSIPQAGRSHIKLAVLNDRVYLGGCNLQKPQDIDVMASWENRETADYVFTLANEIAKTGSPDAVLQNKDVRRHLDDTSDLLIDAGIRRRSIILDEALRLIDEAEERIFMTCQYFPGGTTGVHLAAAAKRGVTVTLYYSPPSVHGLQAPGHHMYEQWHRTRLPAQLFVHRLPKNRPKLHAKVLVSEKQALLGSHNYVVQGVRLGTAEIALSAKEPALGKQLISHFSDIA